MPSPSPETRGRLRDELAHLFDRDERLREVAKDAELDPATILLTGSVKENWGAVVDEASKHDLLLALIRRALREYPESQVLQTLLTKVPLGALAPAVSNLVGALDQLRRPTDYSEGLDGLEQTLHGLYLPLDAALAGADQADPGTVRRVRQARTALDAAVDAFQLYQDLVQATPFTDEFRSVSDLAASKTTVIRAKRTLVNRLLTLQEQLRVLVP